MKDVPEESNARECNTRERSANAVEEPLAERIDGRIYIMRKPKRWHQRIVRILKEMIEEYRKRIRDSAKCVRLHLALLWPVGGRPI